MLNKKELDFINEFGENDEFNEDNYLTKILSFDYNKIQQLIQKKPDDYLKLFNFILDDLDNYHKTLTNDTLKNNVDYNNLKMNNYFNIINNFIKSYINNSNDILTKILELDSILLKKLPRVLKQIKISLNDCEIDSFKQSINVEILDTSKNIFDVYTQHSLDDKNSNYVNQLGFEFDFKFDKDLFDNQHYVLNKDNYELSIVLYNRFLYINCPDLKIDKEDNFIIYNKQDVHQFLKKFNNFVDNNNIINKTYYNKNDYFLNAFYCDILPLYFLNFNNENGKPSFFNNNKEFSVINKIVRNKFINNDNVFNVLFNCSSIRRDDFTFLYIKKTISDNLTNKINNFLNNNKNPNLNINIGQNNKTVYELTMKFIINRNNCVETYNTFIKNKYMFVNENGISLDFVDNTISFNAYDDKTELKENSKELKTLFFKDFIQNHLNLSINYEIDKKESFFSLHNTENNYNQLMFYILEKHINGDSDDLHCINIALINLINRIGYDYISDDSVLNINELSINQMNHDLLIKLFSDIIFINSINFANNKEDVFKLIKKDKETNNLTSLIEYQNHCEYDGINKVNYLNDENLPIYQHILSNKIFFYDNNHNNNSKKQNTYKLAIKLDVFKKLENNMINTDLISNCRQIFLYNKNTIINNQFPISDYMIKTFNDKNCSKDELKEKLDLKPMLDNFLVDYYNYNSTINYNTKNVFKLDEVKKAYQYILVINLLKSYNDTTNHDLKNDIKKNIANYIKKQSIKLEKINEYLNTNFSDVYNNLPENIINIKNTIDAFYHSNIKSKKTLI